MAAEVGKVGALRRLDAAPADLTIFSFAYRVGLIDSVE
jgi:hypothetical protein